MFLRFYFWCMGVQASQNPGVDKLLPEERRQLKMSHFITLRNTKLNSTPEDDDLLWDLGSVLIGDRFGLSFGSEPRTG